MVSWPIRFTRAARQTVIWRCPLRNWHRLDEFFVNNRKVQWVACANLPSRYTQYIPTTYRLCPCSPNIHEYRSCLVSHKQLVNLVLIVTDDNGLQICGLNERAISDLSLCVCFHFFFLRYLFAKQWPHSQNPLPLETSPWAIKSYLSFREICRLVVCSIDQFWQENQKEVVVSVLRRNRMLVHNLSVHEHDKQFCVVAEIIIDIIINIIIIIINITL